jgi:predicted DNA-binding transcriptional regulator YafY
MPQSISRFRDVETAQTLADDSKGEAVRLPLARLLQLMMILQSERFPNARRLADVCAVSRRTIYRDLATLDAAGIAVCYRPERQGYELERGCQLQPVQLDEREALALLIVSRLDCFNDPFGFQRLARSGFAKVMQALPGELRERIKGGGELIADSMTNPELALERRGTYDNILSALTRRRKLRLWLASEESGDLATTKLAIYRLAFLKNLWAVVGYSSAHREIRLFPIPRIDRVELTTEPYAIPPRFRLDRFLSRLARTGSAPAPEDVHLRFSRRVAATVRDSLDQYALERKSAPDGSLDVVLSVEFLDEIVGWVLGFGDQVEVRKPESLRNAVRDWAERIARVHSHVANPPSNDVEKWAEKPVVFTPSPGRLAPRVIRSATKQS